MARAGSSVAGELAADRAAKARAADASMPPPPPSDVERLIGSRRSRIWTLVGTWLGVACSVGFGLYVNYRARGWDATISSSLMAMIPHYLFFALMSPGLYRALHLVIEDAARLSSILRLVAWCVLALGGATLMSFSSYMIRHGLEPTFERLVKIYFSLPAGPSYWAMNLGILGLALAAFAVLRRMRLRDRALWNAAQAELRNARLEAQLADARLQALQAQISPHFVLNSLNAVAGLVQTGERDRAFDAISRLGELLQIVMQNSRNLIVTLGEEMDFLALHLELCRLRFDESIRYCVSVPESLRGRRVPALVVQPLIENALRHGMNPPDPLNVDIRAYLQDDDLVIEVEDDGRGIGEAALAGLPPGHGLANVHERLRLCFGPAATLTLAPRAPQGTVARIVIAG